MRNCSAKLFALAVIVSLLTSAQAKQSEHAVRKETKTESKTLASPTVYEFSREVGPGRVVKQQIGKPGYVKKTYEVVFDGDKVVSKSLIKTEKVEPTPTIMAMGRKGYNGSRHVGLRLHCTRILEMTATGYDTSNRSNGGWGGRTSLGVKAGYGIVAVDPRLIKLGTLVFVEGYGFALAADTGGAIKGKRIDLCFESASMAEAIGRRKVKVHVFDSGQ
ncbi:MAG: G5 domain-containing protein [Armatimonadetes bacterium]|nr:G5 domain-containing protein [Armatimonadota bacterium]